MDLLILETFGYLDELVEAVSVAASVTDVPLIAQATFADDAHTLGGETPREVASVLSAMPVAMIGTNCTVGPQRMLVVAEDLVRYSAVPVSAQPNAGQPRRVGPRSFEFSIDGGYFARYLGTVRRRGDHPGGRLLRHHADAHQGRRRGGAHPRRRRRGIDGAASRPPRSGGRAPPRSTAPDRWPSSWPRAASWSGPR